MATSVVAAIMNLYDSIAAAHFGGTERPPLYLQESPQTKADASQLRPPYAVLTDDGFRPEFDSSFGGIERGEVRVEVYAPKLDDPTSGVVTVDKMLAAVMWGGSAPSARAGLDFGAFTLTGYLYKIELRRKLIRRGYAGFSYQTERIHKGELRYSVITGLSRS